VSGTSHAATGRGDVPPILLSYPRPIRRLKPLLATLPIPITLRGAPIAPSRKGASPPWRTTTWTAPFHGRPGTSLFYYSGRSLGVLSERTFGIVVPKKGEIAWGDPRLRRGSAARRIDQVSAPMCETWAGKTRGPFRIIANILRDRGIVSGTGGPSKSGRAFSSPTALPRRPPQVKIAKSQRP